MNAIYEAIDEFEFSNAVFPMTQEYANWETDAVILCTKWAKKSIFCSEIQIPRKFNKFTLFENYSKCRI